MNNLFKKHIITLEAITLTGILIFHKEIGEMITASFKNQNIIKLFWTPFFALIFDVLRRVGKFIKDEIGKKSTESEDLKKIFNEFGIEQDNKVGEIKRSVDILHTSLKDHSLEVIELKKVTLENQNQLKKIEFTVDKIQHVSDTLNKFKSDMLNIELSALKKMDLYPSLKLFAAKASQAFRAQMADIFEIDFYQKEPALEEIQQQATAGVQIATEVYKEGIDLLHFNIIENIKNETLLISKDFGENIVSIISDSQNAKKTRFSKLAMDHLDDRLSIIINSFHSFNYSNPGNNIIDKSKILKNDEALAKESLETVKQAVKNQSTKENT